MDRETIKTVYEKYGSLIYGQCIRILKSRDEALDAFHEVFLKLIDHYPHFKSTHHILPWVLTVSRNYCFNSQRYKKKFSGYLDVDTIAGINTSAEPMQDNEILRILFSIKNKKIQDAVYYSYVENLTQEEIYKLCGQSPATIRRNLKRFKDMIRRIIKKEYY